MDSMGMSYTNEHCLKQICKCDFLYYQFIQLYEHC